MTRWNMQRRLREAIEKDRLGQVRKLLDRGAIIDDSVFQNAVRKGQIEIVELLLDRGADIHANIDYAVREAARRDDADMVELLLYRGAKIEIINDNLFRNYIFEVIRTCIIERFINQHIIRQLIKNKFA